MIEQSFAQARSPVHRLDARVRIVVAVVFSVVVATSTRITVPLFGLMLGALPLALANLPPWRLATRLAAVNVVVVLLWLFLPFTVPGSRVFAVVGPFIASGEGVALATQITLKCNAIALALTALLSTVEVTTLGHALHHLRVPDKLIHLYLFTVRYVDVLHQELQRLTRAAKVRGFRPGVNRHTYRTYGYLVGMLLLKSVDRAERVLAAMKCRGFSGRFYVLRHFRMDRRDAVFGCLALALLLCLGWVEWTPTLP